MSKKPGRKRSSSNTPAHIIADKLPDRVWFNTSGQGRWMLTYYDNGQKKAMRLCSHKATLSEIWQAYEAKQTKTVTTFVTLSNEFKTSYHWKKLIISTQKDYENCHKTISETKTNNGRLGDEPISAWTTGLICRYRDKRAETSPSRANKEIAYIKRLFSWAHELEKIKTNPALPVKKLATKARQHYATDADYEYMLKIAKQSGYWYLPYAMELAYLCRLRICEVLDLTDDNARDKGLYIERRKGSRANITSWNDRLSAAWNGLKTERDAILKARKQPTPINKTERYLIISARTGDRIQDSSMQTAWKRVRKTAIEQAEKDGIVFTPYNLHDMKRKGITDTTGTLSEKMDASGHRSQEMMKVYDLEKKIVKPTK